ncbi:hypothetical protein Vadar_026145 [Vaccinium darrowii]|uniref:Uncharacterized protein n=1 Tax=Vaccinium darrowii TaxID=229202 RepID=A0ACB7YZ94_9ERIC|nr:hypothetical protein Vadar_026145 [Vaccinium darrowii]
MEKKEEEEDEEVMADTVKLILEMPIHLADQLIRTADDASSFKTNCFDLKEKTQTVATLLHQAARIGKDLYERPTRLVIDDANQVLEGALTLVQKCRPNCLVNHLFFQKTSFKLKNSADNLSWLLRISHAVHDGSEGDYLRHSPPLAANEPVLCFVWEQIAILSSGSLSHQLAAAKSLASRSQTTTLATRN